MLLTGLFKKSSQNNASQVAILLLNLLHVPVTNTTIIETIEGHPDYPSLFSISDSLKKWQIENVAVEINETKLDEVPIPFIAFLKTGGETFILVTKVKATVVSYLSSTGKQKNLSKTDFLKQWGQVVLVAEATGIQVKKALLSTIKKSGLIMHVFLPLLSLAFCYVLLFLLQLYSSSTCPSFCQGYY